MDPKTRRVVIVAGVALAVLLGITVIRSLFVSDDAPPAAEPTTTSSAAPTTPPTIRRPTMNPTPGEAFKIGDWGHPSGAWESNGAPPAVGAGLCRWIIQRDLTGDTNSIIDSGTAGPGVPTRVTLAEDQYFTSTNCQTWRFVD